MTKFVLKRLAFLPLVMLGVTMLLFAWSSGYSFRILLIVGVHRRD